MTKISYEDFERVDIRSGTIVKSVSPKAFRHLELGLVDSYVMHRQLT